MTSPTFVVPGTAGPNPQVRRWLTVLAWTALLAFLGWRIAAAFFVCDDAFIAFRYARNLADGHGLVFNRGERVEGFTDLLWVLQLACLSRLGLRPEIAAPLLSLLLTAGTLGMVVAFARRHADPTQRGLAAWIACAFVGGSASFAAWSTGGLETRQFTFLVAVAVWLASRSGATTGVLVGSSFAFATAEMTRPEGTLLWGCTLAWLLLQDRANGVASWRRVAAFAMPFVLIVGAQFLWRHSYFGEWLPNAYYAKHVRPWYEAGWRYLAAAGLELGAWAWLPLALATAARRAVVRDLAPLLPFVLFGAHALYLARIGGDHFEYRPLDFWLPLVAGQAAAGTFTIANRLARTARSAARPWLVVGIAIPALVCAHAMGHAAVAAGVPAHLNPSRPVVTNSIDAERVPWLGWLPGALPLARQLDPLRAALHAQCVAVPIEVHRDLGRSLRTEWADCERLPTGVFPADAVATAVSVGVRPFHLRELTFVDMHGLTDATVARTPVVVPNEQRRMAHDRMATPNYLRARGVNLEPLAVVDTDRVALAAADLALCIDDAHWLPLLVADLEWAQRTFSTTRHVARHRVDSARPEGNRLRWGGATYAGTRLLATFEEGATDLGWQTEGDVAIRAGRIQVWGGVGPRQLSTEPSDDRSTGRGTGRSTTFVAATGDVLVFALAGERAPRLGVRLCRGSEVLASFFPQPQSRMRLVHCQLDPWAGEPLHLEVHDAGPGWLAIDHVLLVRRTDEPADPASASWVDLDASAMVQLAPATLRDGRAISCTTTITLVNPLPWPTHVAIELDGPAGATLQGDSASVAVPAGATVQHRLQLDIATPFAPAEQPVHLIVRCTPELPDGAGRGATVQFDVAMRWQ